MSAAVEVVESRTIPRYLKVGEAAKAVGLGVSIIKRAVCAGDLRAFRPTGHTVLIRELDLIAWVESLSAATK